jgi:poly-gamma-glutamate synthase PgsB/CapB
MLFVLILAIAYFLYGILEYRFHLRNLQAVPIRVHVNGTRGKSSVTRLIAAGLRAGGIRTSAKTTGSAARYIHPDGSEEPVSRPGPPNIREQIGIVRRAAQEGSRALVIECMALQPELQLMSERRIVRSAVGVITNARPDHLDVMGPTVDDVAAALAGTVPRGAAVFTAEHLRNAPIREAASELGSEYHEVNEKDYPSDIAQGFDYVEHRENIALALAVCEKLGVDRGIALDGMRTAVPDIGALTIQRVEIDGKTIEFVNAFAANDRESTAAVWNAVEPRAVTGRKVIGIVSMRADRPDRALQFGEIVAKDLDADHFILTGGMTAPVKSGAIKLGVPASKLIDLGGRSAQDVFKKILELTTDRSIVIGVGNIGGTGGQIVSLFRERSGTS